MKKIRLSSKVDRVLVTSALVFMLLLFSMLVFALRASPVAFAAALTSSLLLLLLFGTYVLSVWRSACEIVPGRARVVVRGLRTFPIDVSEAAGVSSQPFQMGSSGSRRIVFFGAEGEAIAAFATSFLTKQGALAEPAAREIAQALELPFIPSLQPWEYDRKAKKAHDAELKGKKNTRIGESRPAEEAGIPHDAQDSVNYDALDDEK